MKNIGSSTIGLTYSPDDITDEKSGPVLRASNIQNGKLDWGDTVFVTKTPSEAQTLQDGDILICARSGSRDLIGKNILIRTSELACEATFGAFMTVLRCSDPEFTQWVLSSSIFNSQSGAYMSTTINQLTERTLSNINLAWPPETSRKSITQFLNHETAKIDALISEQERLIELLQDKRQAVISHAVTKGLNPNAPTKDSGVEWLGEVPEHWIGCRFKHCLIGLTDAEHKTCPDHEEGEYLIIRTSNIREGVLITKGAKYTDANGYKEWTTRCTPQEGDVVFTREAPAGEACIIPEGVTACLGQRTVLMHPDSSKVTPEYLVSSIYSGAAKTFIQNLSQGSTVSHLNMSEIGNMPIALPPLDEQLEINKYTKEKSRKFDDLIKQARTSTKQPKNAYQH